jgi:hypothetical protein
VSISPDPVKKDSLVELFTIVKTPTFCFNSLLSVQGSGWLSFAAVIKVLSLRCIIAPLPQHHYLIQTTLQQIVSNHKVGRQWSIRYTVFDTRKNWTLGGGRLLASRHAPFSFILGITFVTICCLLITRPIYLLLINVQYQDLPSLSYFCFCVTEWRLCMRQLQPKTSENAGLNEFLWRNGDFDTRF